MDTNLIYCIQSKTSVNNGRLCIIKPCKKESDIVHTRLLSCKNGKFTPVNQEFNLMKTSLYPASVYDLIRNMDDVSFASIFPKYILDILSNTIIQTDTDTYSLQKGTALC